MRLNSKQRVKYYYPNYYILHFAKLREYYLKGKIKSDFTRDDFRILLVEDDIKEDNSHYVRSFLNFSCREDIGICMHNIKNYNIQINFKEFADLPAYLNYKGVSNYILIKGMPSLEEKLASQNAEHPK